MTAILAFFGSLNLNNLKAALYGWSFNLLFSLGAFAGFYTFLSTAAGEAAPATIPTAFDEKGIFTFILDIFHNYKGSLVILLAILVVLLLLYFLFSIFVSGGIYLILVEKDKVTLSNLFFSSAQAFPAMVKMFLINLLTWSAALILPILSMVLYWKPGLFQVSEVLWPFFSFLWVVVTVFLILVASAIYDFSRISRLAEEKNIFYSLKQGIRFVLSRKLDIVLVFLCYAVTLILFYLVRNLVLGLFENILLPIVLFFIFQVFLLVRYYFKVVLMHAEVKLSGPRLIEE